MAAKRSGAKKDGRPARTDKPNKRQTPPKPNAKRGSGRRQTGGDDFPGRTPGSLTRGDDIRV